MHEQRQSKREVSAEDGGLGGEGGGGDMSGRQAAIAKSERETCDEPTDAHTHVMFALFPRFPGVACASLFLFLATVAAPEEGGVKGSFSSPAAMCIPPAQLSLSCLGGRLTGFPRPPLCTRAHRQTRLPPPAEKRGGRKQKTTLTKDPKQAHHHQTHRLHTGTHTHRARALM